MLSSSLAEMQKWMEDMRVAIEMAKTTNGLSSDLLTCSLTGNSKLDDSPNPCTLFPEAKDEQKMR